MCESRKTFEGPYFSCFHVRERKKNNIVNRFHRIGPEKQAQKKKDLDPSNYDRLRHSRVRILFFFILVLFFSGPIQWNRFTIFFFWVPWRVNMRNRALKCVTRLAHNFKKNAKQGYLGILSRVQILLFFYFCAFFSDSIWWNRFTILFFFSSLTCKHKK